MTGLAQQPGPAPVDFSALGAAIAAVGVRLQALAVALQETEALADILASDYGVRAETGTPDAPQDLAVFAWVVTAGPVIERVTGELDALNKQLAAAL